MRTLLSKVPLSLGLCTGWFWEWRTDWFWWPGGFSEDKEAKPGHCVSHLANAQHATASLQCPMDGLTMSQWREAIFNTCLCGSLALLFISFTESCRDTQRIGSGCLLREMGSGPSSVVTDGRWGGECALLCQKDYPSPIQTPINNTCPCW